MVAWDEDDTVSFYPDCQTKPRGKPKPSTTQGLDVEALRGDTQPQKRRRKATGGILSRVGMPTLPRKLDGDGRVASVAPEHPLGCMEILESGSDANGSDDDEPGTPNRAPPQPRRPKGGSSKPPDR